MAARRATPSSIAAANTRSTFCPRSKSNWSSHDDLKEKTVQAIIGAARTGRIGDGKIFISRVEEAIRIRNDERGETAL
jgi:nitrogen regulatory protein P-II 1